MRPPILTDQRYFARGLDAGTKHNIRLVPMTDLRGVNLSCRCDTPRRVLTGAGCRQVALSANNPPYPGALPPPVLQSDTVDSSSSAWFVGRPDSASRGATWT